MNLVTVTAITKADGTTAIPVASTATVYTPVFELTNLEAFAAQFKVAVSSGTPDIKIELEQSMYLPTSEAADAANSVEPDGASDVITLTDTNLHIKAYSPVVTKYARFKMTGQGANPASATVTISICRQEIQGV